MTKLSLFLLASVLAAQTNYDLLVQGGRVIDPKNGIDARMDVAIANGKIARVAAAIPAAIFYNVFGTRIKEMGARMEDFAIEFQNFAERDFGE